jgi:ankyrin repeat protein
VYTGCVGTGLHELLSAPCAPKFSACQVAPLVDLLIARGADINAPQGGGNNESIVRACLSNDRPVGAELLAARGARLDLDTAASVGRLDIVNVYFDEAGRLKPSATLTQMEEGFISASEYGHRKVVEFLLERGVNLRAGENTRQTALHLAAHRGQLEIVKLLIERGASLEAKNEHGGTVLGQATWSCMHSSLAIDYVPIIETLLAAGANVEEADYPTGNAGVDEQLRRHRSE